MKAGGGASLESRVKVSPPKPAAPPRPIVPERPPSKPALEETPIATRGFNLYYGAHHALKNISFSIHARSVTAIIGPSGCGKSTLLRSFNRMNDLIAGVRTEGEVLVDGRNVLTRETDVVELRRRVGMVFQRANPFPSRSSPTSTSACGCSGCAIARKSRRAWSRRCARRRSGTR